MLSDEQQRDEVIDPVSSGADTDGFQPESEEDDDDDEELLTAEESDEVLEPQENKSKRKSKGTRKMRGIAARQSVKEA